MIDHKNHYARYCELISLAASSAPARQRDGGYMAAVYILSADKTLCDIARRKICPDGISFPGILSVARRGSFIFSRSCTGIYTGSAAPVSAAAELSTYPRFPLSFSQNPRAFPPFANCFSTAFPRFVET